MTARRLTVALASLAAAGFLSACGFSPLYSTAGYDQLGGLEVNAGNTRFDYMLQDAVRDFVGPGASNRTLDITTRLTSRPTGISPTGVALRLDLDGTARWILHTPDGSLRGVSQASLGFDQTGDPYAIISSRGEAEERLAARLAEEVLQDVTVALRRRQAGLTP